MRPEVGTQAQFRKKKPPVTYRYDSSLSPALDWDGQNPAREQAEVAIRRILEAKTLEEAKRAGAQLNAISKPFLNWAGKAERRSFEVPTLPLFIHERLSTKAIIETLAVTSATSSRPCSSSSATHNTLSPTRCCAPTSTQTSG
jgi:adenine-specific DNA-methyltransferase